MTDRAQDPVPLDTLKGVVNAAASLARELAADPLLERLLAVFSKFPAHDRDVILGILEREAESKMLAETVAGISGISLRPNPRARLYLRVIEQEPSWDVTGVENDRIMLASVRAIRMLHKVIMPIYERWRVATLEAIGSLSAEERAGVAWFNREMLKIVETVEGDAQ